MPSTSTATSASKSEKESCPIFSKLIHRSVSLPALQDVKGAFNLQSSQNLTSACNHFQPLSGPNNVIKGTYTCSGGEASPGGTGTLSSGTNSGNGGSSSSSSHSFAHPLYIPTATGFLGVVAAIFGML